MFGYHGQAMVVDLTSRIVRTDPIPHHVLRQFIGGIGLGTYLLYNYCPARVDPLGPDNPLIFVGSPLIGSKLTTSSKFAVLAKSPLTGFIGDSLSSSFLALELKKTGHDALIIIGRCENPTLLSVIDGRVKFIDATDLLGLSTSDTEMTIKTRLGRQTRVACIGPAGERLVRFATISNDGGRQAGRTGTGAVMGSKNLKAIALKGNINLSVNNPKKLSEIQRTLTQRSLGVATEKYRSLGTIANVSVFNRLGTLPTYNFKQSTFEQTEPISGESLHNTHFLKNAHCASCTIGCEQIMSTNDSLKKSTGRMEYESTYALGPLLGISDPNTVIRASHLCDDLGIDTISTGVTIAWAMECFEKGILTRKDTSGIELKFGNTEAILPILYMISNREGIGDLLADGCLRAAKAVGSNSEDWAMQVKGLEMPGYEPRSLKTMALGLAVSTRGACHNRSSAYEADFSALVDRLSVDEVKGQITKQGEDFSSVLDSLIWCKFLRKAFQDFYTESAAIYEYVTGFNMDDKQLRLAGERINNLKKLFNIREGWTREDDTLPSRSLQEKLPTGIVKGEMLLKEDLDIMIASYYKARGWTKRGLIPRNKLEELELSNLN